MSGSCDEPIRVLIADDEPDVLEAYREALGQAPGRTFSSPMLEDLEQRIFGNATAILEDEPETDAALCMVRQAEAAVEAVAEALEKDEPFAVALMDVRMPPGHDGIWAAERIRALDPHVQIVIVTAYSDVRLSEIRRRIPPPDGLLYLQKPCYPHELRQTVRALGAKWRVRRQLEAAQQDLAKRNAELQELADQLRLELQEVRQLDLERARLYRGMEQLEEAIVITDPERRILYVNAAFENSTGYPRAEAIGATPAILKSGRHTDAHYAGIYEALGQGRTWRGNFINRRKDGSLYQAETTITPVYVPSGELTNFVAVSRDVTERLALEQQVRQKQKLEVLGTLAGGVAHDFNNLLTIIAGHGELLQAKVEDQDGRARHIEEIRRGADRAAALTGQLLAFSRKQAVEPRILDLSEAIADARKMVQRLVRENIELAIELEEGIGTIRADPTQIEQMLLNLVINACDAMPDGGRLAIRTGEKHLDDGAAKRLGPLEPGPYATLLVSDTGTGMKPETLQRIFEPFFTTKPKGRGTGLGLSTAYGIVRHARGAIRVESNLGEGTTFEVYLPVNGAEAAVREPEVAAPEEGQDAVGTVLVVEDETEVRRLCAEALTACGYQVLEAADGIEALGLLERRSDPIDLLLTDVVMPRMSGPDLADRARQACGSLRVLYMSGYVEPRGEGADPELRPMLAKPFTPRVLARRVGEVLARPV